MAIVHARVDERLIHGQVAMVWTNTVGATRILVVNDAAVKDELIIAGLKMAKPAGVRLSILSLKRAAERFKEGAYEEDKVFLITKSVPDMARLVADGLPIPLVNVGNVAKREGSRPIKKSVNLTPQDEECIRHILAKGIPVTAQMIPNESSQSIETYL